MVPCPGAGRALELLADRPDLAVGIHLTLIADFPARPWQPLTGALSLLAPSGTLFTVGERDQLLWQANTADVTDEFRAQIETALDGGLSPTHLDWHCLADGGRPDIFDATLVLADEYGIAVRAWLGRARTLLQQRHLPVQDQPFLDSFAVPIKNKAEELLRRLRALPEGLTEWAMHPARPDTIDSGADIRQSDYGFLTSPEAREVVEEEGITLIGYRYILDEWRHHQPDDHSKRQAQDQGRTNQPPV